MAKAHKCDRCGSFYEEFKYSDHSCRFRLFSSEYDSVIGSYYHNVDLCPNCAKKLDEWMDYKPEPVVIKGDLNAVSESLKKCMRCLEEGLYPRPTITVEVKKKKKRWWKK